MFKTFMAAGMLLIGMAGLTTSADAKPHHASIRSHHGRLSATVLGEHHHARGMRHVARNGRAHRVTRVASAGGRARTGLVQTGRASFYGGGGRTAAGGHVGAATCAHRSLPFGTRVLVTNLRNLRRTVLTVNDRGPFVGGRVIDVSRGAAGTLGMLQTGTASVRVEVLGRQG